MTAVASVSKWTLVLLLGIVSSPGWCLCLSSAPITHIAIEISSHRAGGSTALARITACRTLHLSTALMKSRRT
jgi:hypothetical protein